MNKKLDEILKNYSTKNPVFFENSSANTVFFQLFGEHMENEDTLIKIANDLMPLDLIADDWLLYMLSKNLLIDTLENLSTNGFNINLTDDNGENILFKIFETTRYDINDKNFNLFQNAIEKLMALGVDYRLIDRKGRNIIHKATISGATGSVLNFVASQGANVNQQDNDGFTPLHFAVINASLNQITTLVQNGAGPSKHLKTTSYNYDTENTPSRSGLTPKELFETNRNDYVDMNFEEISELLK